MGKPTTARVAVAITAVTIAASLGAAVPGQASGAVSAYPGQSASAASGGGGSALSTTRYPSGPDITGLYADAPMGRPPTRAPMVTRGVGLATRAASQCSGTGFDGTGNDQVLADGIMAGRFKFERYGYMSVPSNPSWGNQGSLDYSGNGMQHGLFWALPLLRVGVATNRPDMVARFYALVDDWLRDNPVKRPRSWQAYGQIESGFRMITLACAAQFAGPRTRRYVRALRGQARWAAPRWRLVNNASFHQAAGIFAASCILPDRKLRRRSLSYLARTAGSLIHPDGSVFEGSLEYARATYIWTREGANRVAACGIAPPGELARADLIPNFLAHGVRPDGRYEALGDGGAKIAYAGDAPAGTFLQYASTAGSAGPKPQSLFARFGAGFLFGRSGWGVGAAFAGETFYSVRTGAGPSQVYHAHADAGALTVHALGSQLLFDAGPYAGSSMIRTRAAHNVVSVDGMTAGSPAPTVVAARSTAEGDLLTLTDRAYRRTGLTRTVWYDRRGDFFVVVDAVRQRRRRTVSQNWNVGRDRTVEVIGSSAHTSGSGANISLISVGSAPEYSLLRGSHSPWGGWNSQFYSEVSAAPSLRVKGRDKRVYLTTVIIPRAEGVEPTAVSAAGENFPGGAAVMVRRGDQNYGLRITGYDVTRL